MKRVSVRTLALMLNLLLAVVSYQYLAVVRQPVEAGAVWLAGSRTVIEPNQCAGNHCQVRP